MPHRRHEGERPHQILLVGRDGSGKQTLFEALQRVFPVISEHTRLDTTGLRQLALLIAGRAVSLIDLGSTAASATQNPSRLRKATMHFDGLAGTPRSRIAVTVTICAAIRAATRARRCDQSRRGVTRRGGGAGGYAPVRVRHSKKAACPAV